MIDSEDKMRFLFQLRQSGVLNKAVLEVMEQVDRALFVDGVFSNRAYDDTALPIECGQTISMPSVVGIMTQALELDDRCKVLEIGTGSGYQTAILSKLSRRVYTIERHKRLAKQSANLFQELGYSNISTLAADGTLGFPEQAPFDRIIVTAAAEDIPALLLSQLKVGGIMVIPVGGDGMPQTLIQAKKTEIGVNYHELEPVRFVPLLEGVSEDIFKE